MRKSFLGILSLKEVLYKSLSNFLIMWQNHLLHVLVL